MPARRSVQQRYITRDVMRLAQALVCCATDVFAWNGHAELEVGRENVFEALAEGLEGGVGCEVDVAAGWLLGLGGDGLAEEGEEKEE